MARRSEAVDHAVDRPTELAGLAEARRGRDLGQSADVQTRLALDSQARINGISSLSISQLLLLHGLPVKSTDTDNLYDTLSDATSLNDGDGSLQSRLSMISSKNPPEESLGAFLDQLSNVLEEESLHKASVHTMGEVLVPLAANESFAASTSLARPFSQMDVTVEDSLMQVFRF